MSQITTMDEITSRSVSQPRFYMMLLGLFASLGLILASIGVYGVMSYSVAQRHQELGIRIALGAKHRDVIRLIVRDGLALAAIGVGIGAIASFALTRLIKGFLFGISPTDPMTFVGVAGLLLLVALLACWIPARRATLIDPLIALRAD
jgi:ABC-type antimicrobial peptide transport system permease subunit